ncbi:thiamine pyrophosphate-binding protein [Pseudonocardia acaciae]|uniref:thiamine pyrophosphate-binding protein n=1 Tax=Pseudonocardia acaciae TaxID=551276 RepID=UPI0004916CE9|nr:thiamine pyrophosphate-binding protein [Pseudonocardia acaciae]
MNARTGADAVLEVLLAWGVRRVFICPGSTEAAFLDATVRHPDFEVVLTTHESVTVAMADGHARATGEPAVAYLHTHLGLVNGLAHLDAARMARSPVVVLNGLKAASIQARGGFTALPATGELARPFVKRAWQSLTTAGLPEDVTQALRAATAEPSGPVWLGLAQDLMETVCPVAVPDPARHRVSARTAPDPERLREAAELLRSAERPVLVAGAEVGRHGAQRELVALAERLGAPVCNEDRRGFERPGFPADHPLHAGGYSAQNPAVAGADVLVFLGCRCFVEFEPSPEPPVPPCCRVIHSHVDPSELAKLQGTDVALVADESLVAAGLLDLLGDARAPARPPVPSVHTEPPTPSEHTEPPAPATVHQVAAALAEVVDDRTTVFEDATTSEPALLRALPLNSVDALFTTASGSLGWGMGAALGYQLGAPERRVLAVVGDGVFQFGPQALWVAARHRIPVLFVVINNRSYAAVAAALRRYGGTAARVGSYPGKDISGVDIAAVARGFGLPARRLDRAHELPAAVKELGALDGPALIEVLTDPDDLGAAPR